MKRYRFYIAWFSGSEGADFEENGINEADDLKPQHEAGNLTVKVWEYEAASENEAWKIGKSLAFQANFTSSDSVSYVEEI